MTIGFKRYGENNGHGKVYSFALTTGKGWQMVEYEGVAFRITEEMIVLFMKMDKNEKRWMSSYSVVVECLNFSLTNEGIVKDGS